MPFVDYMTQVKLSAFSQKRVQLFILVAPIHNQWEGDEINWDMSKSSEKESIRREKGA